MSMSKYIYVYVYVYVYVYFFVYICVYVYVYFYVYAYVCSYAYAYVYIYVYSDLPELKGGGKHMVAENRCGVKTLLRQKAGYAKAVRKQVFVFDHNPSQNVCQKLLLLAV